MASPSWEQFREAWTRGREVTQAEIDEQQEMWEGRQVERARARASIDQNVMQIRDRLDMIGEYVTHLELVQALLYDGEGEPAADAASRKLSYMLMLAEFLLDAAKGTPPPNG